MAKGFDDYKNGLAFGAIFGALVAYIALMAAAPSWISWLGTLLTSFSTWLVAQSYLSSIGVTTMSYAVAILVGAVIGIIIDKQ